jgi:hypothetical protein
LWITKDKASKSLVCVSSLKGIASAKRRDFTGRVIFDSVALISSCLIGSSEEHQTLLEHESISRGFAGATLDMNVALDGSANMEDFDKDAFPFSDVNSFFESLPSDIADVDMNPSTQDGLGSANSIINLLKELNITFSVRHQDSPSQDSGQYSSSTFGATRYTPPSDRKCLLDGAFEAVEAVEEKVEELTSELVGEERAGSLFRPLKKFKSLFPGNLIKTNRSVKRPSDDSQNTGSPASKRSVLANSATSTVVISTMPSPQLLSKLLHEIFIVASRAESVCIGFLIGGGDRPEMIYGTGKDPAELLLVLIRG